MREAFYAINKNADGWISSAEFVAALPKLGLENMPAAEMGELLKLADQDKDGFLNYREFVAQFAGDAGRANLTTYLRAPKKKRASGSEAILSTLALLAARSNLWFVLGCLIMNRIKQSSFRQCDLGKSFPRVHDYFLTFCDAVLVMQSCHRWVRSTFAAEVLSS